MKDFPFHVEISMRHVHLSAEDFAKLFGADAELSYDRPLSVIGEYKTSHAVTLIGPKRSIERVAVLGPFRKQTQVEISVTDSFTLGVKDVPVRLSGDLAGSAPIKIRGTVGEIDLPEGLIIAKRHIHVSPDDMKKYGLTEGQEIDITAGKERPATFHGVVVRSASVHIPMVHLDSDEGNAVK